MNPLLKSMSENAITAAAVFVMFLMYRADFKEMNAKHVDQREKQIEALTAIQQTIAYFIQTSGRGNE